MSKTEYIIADLEAENDTLRQRAERAERILATLREPNYEVTDAADTAYFAKGNGFFMKSAIRAAVAAATQEVDRG